MPEKIPESVLVVIHTPELTVLLLERADCADYWQSVTGSCEHFGEPLRETCRREVGEETGFAFGTHASCLCDWNMRNVYAIHPQWLHRYARGVTHNTEHVFSLRVPEAFTPILAPGEHLRHAWLGWQEAAARCASPTNAEAIRMLPVRA